MAVGVDRRAMFIALAGAAVISFSPVFYVYSNTNPSTGAFFRMLYAFPILAFLAFLVRKSDTRPSRVRWMAFGAGLILAPDMLSYHISMNFIGIGVATLIGNSQVILVTLVSWKLFGERPNPAILFSLPVVMIGLVLISGIADAEPYGADPMKGVLFGIFTAFFYSAFLIAFRAGNRGLAPVASVQFDATAGAALGMFVLGILPLSTLSVEPIDFQVTWPGHGWLILLAVLSQVGGWLAVAYALPRLPAAHTSFAILLQPVLTLLWGFLILNQDGHSTNQLVGMVLVLVAIASVTVYGSASTEDTESE